MTTSTMTHADRILDALINPFADIERENDLDEKLLSKATEEYRTCVAEYIGQIDNEIDTSDWGSDHQYKVCHRVLDDFRKEVGDRCAAISDPGRHGRTLDDVSYHLDDVAWAAQDHIEDLMHYVADRHGVTLDW